MEGLIAGINYVPDKYIMYEMKIRGINLRGTSMKSRKNRLQKILENELESGVESDMFFHMQLADDLEECVGYLEEIGFLMQTNLENNAIASEYQLMFLKERVERLPPSPMETLSTQRTSILSKIEELEKQFGDVTVAVAPDTHQTTAHVSNVLYNQLGSLNLNSLSLGQNPRHSSTIRNQTAISGTGAVSRPTMPTTPPSPHVSFDLTNSPDLNATDYASLRTPNTSMNDDPVYTRSNSQMYNSNTAGAVPENSIVKYGHNPSVQMWKWNLRFNGDRDEMTANDFIQKLMDLGTSRNVSESHILNGITELLSGSAAKWYRAAIVSKPFTDFADFATRFIDDFDPLYKVDTRLETLKKRLQRFDERVVQYFAHMENEFSLIAKRQPVHEQIRIIRKNLLPHFISHLACKNFKTVDELRQACKNIEVSQDMIRVQNAARRNESFANNNGQNNSSVQQMNQYRNNNYGQNQNKYNYPPQNQSTNQLPIQNSNNDRPNQNQANNTSLQVTNPTQQFNNRSQQPANIATQNNNGNAQNKGAPTQQQYSYNSQSRQQFPNYQNQSNYSRVPQPDRLDLNASRQLNSNPAGQNNGFQRNNQNNNRQSGGFQNFTGNLDGGNYRNRSFAQSNAGPQANSLADNSNVACASNQMVMPFTPDLNIVENQVDSLIGTQNDMDINPIEMNVNLNGGEDVQNMSEN